MTITEDKIQEAAAPSGNGVIAERVNRVKENLSEQAERRIRDVKRIARKGQYALEDRADEVTLRVRRNPGKALAIAFAAGTLAGAVLAFAMRRRRTIA